MNRQQREIYCHETLRVTYLRYGIYEHTGPNRKFVVKTVGLDYKLRCIAAASHHAAPHRCATPTTMQYATLLTVRLRPLGGTPSLCNENADNMQNAFCLTPCTPNLHHPRRGSAGLTANLNAGLKHRAFAEKSTKRRLINPYLTHRLNVGCNAVANSFT
jgi:hypothetical protein